MNAMFEKFLVRHCAPTLAGMKTGSMFSCTYDNTAEIQNALRRFNQSLGKKGIRLIPLRFQNHRALIYVYRPSRLSCDLQGHTACGLLEKCGYCMESPGHCLIHLISRMKEGEEFPHEVGLFLGYPPEDVCGFIENRAENCKCVGCWKVYGNTCEAQKTFAKHKKCTAVYSMQHAQGTSIERLTVAG